MFSYIFKGKSHTDTSAQYMESLGMDDGQKESVLADKAYEQGAGALEKRAAAYKNEVDPLTLEGALKQASGDEQGATAAFAAAAQKRMAVQARYPVLKR